MNLKYVFDKGYVKAYYKKLDDRNTFYLPIPLIQNGNDLKGFPDSILITELIATELLAS